MVDAFDRVHFHISAPLPGSVIAALCELATEAKQSPLAGGSRHTYKLELLQPHMEAFETLLNNLPNGTACAPAYAEVARDISVSSQRAAGRMALDLLEHCTLKYCRRHVKQDGSGFYYNARTAPVVLMIYGDRKSKLATAMRAQPCLHMELRLQGQALERNGLAGVSDFSSFDFRACWRRNLHVWKLPAQDSLAAALGSRASSQPARRRAVRNVLAKPQYRVGGALCLQLLVAEHAGVKRLLKPMKFAAWKEQAHRTATLHTSI